MPNQFQVELDEIENQLSQPDVFSDYKKAGELLKRKSEIEKLLESQNNRSQYEEIIMEIRAGVGGDEAALFAQDLCQMYKKFAENQNWTVNILDASRIDIGGYKQVTFEVFGFGAFEKFKNESGVHRVQRVPKTEKSGRVHTSTATVAVLRKAKETDVQIKPEELEISFFRSGGPGGQNVNKVETAVRILHKPSGVVVSSQEERSQSRNREKAMEILRTKIFDLKQQEEMKKTSQLRKSQIGSGERSEKIRTYNFPQDRVTDHRISKSWSNIESIMDGEINKIIEAVSLLE